MSLGRLERAAQHKSPSVHIIRSRIALWRHDAGQRDVTCPWLERRNSHFEDHDDAVAEREVSVGFAHERLVSNESTHA